MKPTIAILTHAFDEFMRRRYLVRLLMPRWEAMGYHVMVVSGPKWTAPADVALLHVDLSVVPPDYLDLASRYPRVVNGRVTDIRKRRFSRLVVDRAGPEPGPVVVKSDANCGGRREQRVALLESRAGGIVRIAAQVGWLKRVNRWVSRRGAWRFRQTLPDQRYPIFATRAAVPRGVWGNPRLIVERFLPEQHGTESCCRHWLFFGTREVTRRTWSKDPVVKFGPQTRLERTDDVVPDELRAMRRELGFDFGKFDYGVVDGRLVLYDVNRTPGGSANAADHRETVDVLSEGIRDL